MGWEIVKGRSNSTTFAPMNDDEISIVGSKQRNKETLRVNSHRKTFPVGTKSVKVMIDRDKKRIGFFTLKQDELFDGKKLSDYGKNSANIYISMPRVIAELGFTKGRYKITKKDDIDGLIFMVYAKNKIETESKSEV